MAQHLSSIPVEHASKANARSVDDSTLVTFELRVNRTDLAGNHLPAPERWSLEDAAEADRLGLVYEFALTLRDGIRP